MLYFKIVYSFERLLVCVYTSQYCLSGCSHLGAFITNTNILYHAHNSVTDCYGVTTQRSPLAVTFHENLLIFATFLHLLKDKI